PEHGGKRSDSRAAAGDVRRAKPNVMYYAFSQKTEGRLPDQEESNARKTLVLATSDSGHGAPRRLQRAAINRIRLGDASRGIAGERRAGRVWTVRTGGKLAAAVAGRS